MKKIFVADRASLGDTLLATPTLRAIKETYPDSRTIMMASPSSKEILDGHPFVDELLLYEKGDSVFPIIKKIWRADLALILDFHYRSSLFAWLACIPRRIGRSSKKQFFLTDRVLGTPNASIYEVENTLAVARYAGIDTEKTQLIMAPCHENEKQHVKQLLVENKIDVIEKSIIVLAPYSLSYLKDWPEEYYQQLIDFLVLKQFVVVIIGGKENRERAEKFSGSINMVGLLNIRETTYLISLAKLIVCGCTSVLHFAATTDTPQVAIYGPTAPIQWAPRKNCIVITKTLPCSPCYSTGRECQDDKRCVRQITPNEVCTAVSQILHI